MNTIILFIISFLVLGVSVMSFAQVIDTNAKLKAPSVTADSKNSQNVSSPTHISQNRELNQKALKNQIYIDKDWAIGKIVLLDGGVIDNYLLRYNLLTDQMEFIFGNDTLVFVNPQNINTVTFGEHTFVYENYLSGHVVQQGYFELIVPGKNKLMVKRWVAKQKPDARYPDDPSLTKYKVEECYFISKPGIPANKLACNRRSVLMFLNGHNEDIAEYLRITGNKVHTIEDLILLVSYYNSLDEEY